MARPLSRHSRGFTLIELLVVVSIIGLLSAIVLAALSGAKTKGNEAVIIQELVQFRNLYESSYSTYGNYTALQPIHASTGFATNLSPSNCFGYSGYVGSSYYCNMSSAASCSAVFGSGGEIPDTNSLNLCNKIISSSGFFYVGVASNTNVGQKYSLWAYLPSQGTYMCMGSSKQTSSISTFAQATDSVGTNANPGCSANP